jgi:signal transduction histidine kinase
MKSIRKSFSTKLSLGILLLAAPIFAISLGILFTQSRHMIRSEAVGRANSVLNTTMQRLCRNLLTIETATNSNAWLIEQSFVPDTILAYSNRIVRFNPHIDGCSVSAEPNFFPQYGRYFSAYTIREKDTINTVVEEEYEYFDRLWYKSPREKKAPCWEVYYDDETLNMTLDGMIASYGRPLYAPDSTFIGIISTDLSLLRLSKVMSQEKPYPNSYYMMIGSDGRYFVHPDTARLFTQTIFTNAEPDRHSDIIALGHEMTEGRQGHMRAVVDGIPSLVCYRPVPGTTWSLAIVCPDSDVLAGYYRLTYIVIPLLVLGIIIILFLCHRTVAQTIRPIHELLDKTQSITEGNMEVHIPRSARQDVIGQLQNSFASMLQWLNFHMGSIRYTSSQTEQRNKELEKATLMVEEADRQKTAFIQNVSHQIRTPLNIIMGFAQVLRDMPATESPEGGLSDEEMKNITAMMNHNSKLLNRMLLMLFDSSDSGLAEELKAAKHDRVSCRDVSVEAIGYIRLYYPDTHFVVNSNVPDGFCIKTSRLYLMRTLREVLYNAAKYSDGKNVTMTIERNDTFVRFIVEDTGKGIAPADREHLFQFFTKVDDLSEGLGLGLPLAKRHARNLGGDLTLDTDYHNGCRFVTEIPIR